MVAPAPTTQKQPGNEQHSRPVWTVSAEKAKHGVDGYPKEIREDLLWHYHFARNQGMSVKEAADQVGVDSSTYSRIFRGAYRDAKQMVLPPPEKMLARIRVVKDQETHRVRMSNNGRIMTPTVETIWTICKMAWRKCHIAIIYGNSHIGKTWAGEWFVDVNNHGQAIYVDVQGLNGVKDVYRAFAKALHVTGPDVTHKMKDSIINTLGPTNLVVIDEFHQILYSYQRAASIKMVEAIKNIKDRSGCAMVLLSTLDGREQMKTGRNAKFLQQIGRRGTIKKPLPSVIPIGDVRAFAKAFGLDFPPPRKGERWKHLPDTGHIGQCKDIAHWHGIERLRTTFEDAVGYARKKGESIDWKHFRFAHEVYVALEQEEEV